MQKRTSAPYIVRRFLWYFFLAVQNKMKYNVNVPLPGVEWDEEKNALNKTVHHIAFEDAQYIFSDENRIERIDQSEGNIFGEERWQTIGKVGKLFFVVYTELGENRRIISARLAEKHERRSYNGYYQIDGKGWDKAT